MGRHGGSSGGSSGRSSSGGSRGTGSSRVSSGGVRGGSSSSSSSRSSSSFGGSSSGNSRHSSPSYTPTPPRHNPPPPPPRYSRPRHTTVYVDHGHRNYGGSYGRQYGNSRTVYNRDGFESDRYRRRFNDSLKLIIMLFIVLIVMSAYNSSRSSKPVSTEISTSTVNREKLDTSIVIKSKEWIKDDYGWLNNKSKVESAMNHFYEKTGVQPYLWIEEMYGVGTNIDEDAILKALDDKYNSMFKDDGHMIYMFISLDNDKFVDFIQQGSATYSVIDPEATSIIYDYAGTYYNYSMSDDEYFSKIFTDSADRIMRKTTTSKDVNVAVLNFIKSLIVIFVIVLIVFKVLETKSRKAEALARQRESTERILENSTNSTSSLKDKYKDENEEV